MSFPVQPVLKKTFTSTGAVTSFSIPTNATKVEIHDLTNNITTANATAGAEAALYQKAEAVNGMAAGSGYRYVNTVNTKTITQALIATNGAGFTFFDSSLTSPGAAVATTATTAANPAVVSTASTAGLIAGNSIVRVINLTNMEQIAGMEFTVGTIVANTSFGLKYLDASGFAAPGTNGFYRIIPFDSIYYPRRRFITKITQANPAVVTMSVTHGFTVGQQVRLIVPSEFGMTQMNGQLATITAVTSGATNTITLNIDSSGFSAFAFPTSAVASAGVTFAQVVPVGEAATAPFQNLLDDATVNQSARGVTLDTNVVGALGDNMLLIAYSGLSF